MIKLGPNIIWPSPPRPAIVSAWQCEAQGGQYAIASKLDARQTAINVWLRCADEGDKVAQTYLGEIYARAWNGTPPDFDEAVKWFKKAAEQGYSRAQKNLGLLYEQGLGVLKDPSKALELYRKAVGLIAPVNLDPDTKSHIETLSQKLAVSEQNLKRLQDKLDAAIQASVAQSQSNSIEMANLKAELQKSRAENASVGRQLNSTEIRAALDVAPGVKPYLGRFYAIVIGINAYQPSLQHLKTPVNDAKRVEAMLREKYGFETMLLTDDTARKPTRDGIYEAIYEVSLRLQANDNLLVYYAGHGDISVNSYFWLPKDAEAGKKSRWISVDDIQRMMDSPPMRAKRVLIVADSCYPAGLIASVINASPVHTASTESKAFAYRGDASAVFGTISAATGMPDFSGTSPESKVAWIRAKSEKKSRTALTSGLLEPVPDVDSGNGLSIFANAFLEALDRNDDVISAEQIYLEISPEVFAKSKKLGNSQMPAYGAIPKIGHGFGEFYFVASPHQNGG
ncbi:MAG: caspase family protein [Gammaproteobacteria bacterium]